MGRPTLPQDSIYTAKFQHKADSSEMKMTSQLVQLSQNLGKDTGLSSQQIKSRKAPGKIVAMRETVQFLQQHPLKTLTGNGMGNFSSKLAFRTAGLNIAGGYPKKYAYINDDFKDNHLSIFLDYFEKDSGYHSITNSPNSVYGQLLGEYGVAGLFALLIYYLGWFAKGIKKLTYGIPVLLLLSAAFFADYWFEQLSIIIVFELLLFLDKKETAFPKIS